MRVKNKQGDVPGTKPSFYGFSILNLFADTWRGIRGQTAPNCRQPDVPFNIPSCTALVYKESITADKFFKISV